MGVKYNPMQQVEVYPQKLTLTQLHSSWWIMQVFLLRKDNTRVESRMKYIGIKPNSDPPMSNNDMKNM